jgi:16S rRNA (uracil1498-N3)-methyltransferase
MNRRCYSEMPITGRTASLGGSEAHHLLHVLRATPGMRVTLFDGSGREFEAEVAHCGRSTVDLTILAEQEVDRELPFPLTLGVAMPKGDRQRWIVEKATELGVTRLVPLITQYSGATNEKSVDGKLSRYVVEASKQCGRNTLMQITEPMRWERWLQLPEEQDQSPSNARRRWLAHPSGRVANADELAAVLPAFLAVGPEGGLSDAEVEAAQKAGWEIIGLGPRILRIETAAIALVALLTLSKA